MEEAPGLQRVQKQQQMCSCIVLHIETWRAKTRVSWRRSHACTLRSPHALLCNRIVEFPWKHD